MKPGKNFKYSDWEKEHLGKEPGIYHFCLLDLNPKKGKSENCVDCKEIREAISDGRIKELRSR